MSFMEPEVFKSRVVTLTDARGEGTCLPYSVLDTNERNAVDFLACFESIAERPEAETPEAEAVKLLSQFMESCAPLVSVEVSKREVWVGRMSALGYLDCTAWEWSANRRELERSLRG